MRWLIFFLVLFFSPLFGDAPKAIIFDYGGVVAKVDRSPMLHFLSDSLSIPYSKLRNDFASDKLYEMIEKPPIFWKKYAKKKLPAGFESNFAMKKEQMIRKIPGMEELIISLKSQGIQVVLLSNTKEMRARFIEQQGGYDLFDPILLSCHLGLKKPDIRIYEKLLTLLPYKAEECVFIDNRKKNIQAAQSCGLDGIVFESVDLLKEELSKRGLGSLIKNL